MHRILLIAVGCAMVGAAGCSSTPTSPGPNSARTATDAAAPVASETGGAPATASPQRFGTREGGTVFVTSQGLYYDTFVVTDPLPMEGPFQLLTNGKTEFGPGQPGYLGGRWWEDTNANGVQDEGDHFFLCPLLPPGRPIA